MSRPRTPLPDLEASVSLLEASLSDLEARHSAAEAELDEMRTSAAARGEPLIVYRSLRDGPARRAWDLTQTIGALTEELAKRRAELQILKAQVDLRKRPVTAIRDSDANDVAEALVRDSYNDLPYVLFPVRLETRFKYSLGRTTANPPNKLCVRVVPDDIHVQTDPAGFDTTTRESVAAAAAQYRAEMEAVGANTIDDSRADAVNEAHRQLVGRVGPRCAASIVLQERGLEAPMSRDDPAWLGLLPKFWVVVLRFEGRTLSKHATRPVIVSTLLNEPTADAPLVASWTSDFAEAERVGMAITVDLTNEEREVANSGLDVYAVGVDHTAEPLEASATIEEALRGHQSSSGLRLLPKGTPTNNTIANRVPAPPDDDHIFQELISPPSYPETPNWRRPDAAKLETALGLSAHSLASIARPFADKFLVDDRNARSMSAGLFPISQQYQGIDLTGVVPPYGHFTRFVRPAGPLPAIAVGDQPYGLAVTGPTEKVSEGDLSKKILRISPFSSAEPWKTALESTPNAPAGVDTLERTAEMLRLSPSSSVFSVRRGSETDVVISLDAIAGFLANGVPIYAMQAHSWLPLLRFEKASHQFTTGLIRDASAEAGAAASYLSHLLDDFRRMRDPTVGYQPGERPSNCLLYLLLRYSALLLARSVGGLSTDTPPMSPFMTHVTNELGIQPGQVASFGSTDRFKSAMAPSAIQQGLENGTLTTEQITNTIDALAGGTSTWPIDGTFNVPDFGDLSTNTNPDLAGRFDLSAGAAGDDSLGTDLAGDDLLPGGHLVEGFDRATDLDISVPDASNLGVVGNIGNPLVPADLGSLPVDPGLLPPGGDDIDFGPAGDPSDPRPDPFPPDGQGPRTEEELRDLLKIPISVPVLLPRQQAPDRVETVEVNDEERVAEFDEALSELRALDDAELQRLMSETLDAAAYRRDAWVTAIHTRHLQQLRAENPEGCYLGGYGVVLGLKPDPEAPIAGTDGSATPLKDPHSEHGFVIGHSQDQAETLAVIRNAQVAHHSDDAALTLNLSSKRVRDALELLDGVHDQRPPSEVLGSQFERLVRLRDQELFDRQQSLGLAQFLPDLRRRFPGTGLSTDPDDAVDMTIDGIALLQAWRRNQSVNALLDHVPLEHADQLARLLDVLDGLADAANDLLLFDATLHTTFGSRDAATRSFDAHAGLAEPGDIDSILTPPRGPAFTHNVVVATTHLKSNWDGPHGVRAMCAPGINRLIGHLLGDPKRIMWGARATDSNGVSEPISLAKLAIDPIDLVWTAESWARQGAANALHPLLAQHLAAPGLEPGSYTPVIDRSLLELSTDQVALGELGEVCFHLLRALRTSRPLRAADLAPAGSEPAHTLNLASTAKRLNDAVERVRNQVGAVGRLQEKLHGLAEDLPPNEVSPDLARDAQNVVGATARHGGSLDPTPLNGMSRQRLEAFRQSLATTAAQLTATTDAATTLLNDFATNPHPTGNQLVECCRVLAGRDVPFGLPFSFGGPLDVDAVKVQKRDLSVWLRQAARVLPALEEWELATDLTSALNPDGNTILELTVSQGPSNPQQSEWIGAQLEESPDRDLTATTSVISLGPQIRFDDEIEGLWLGVLADRIPAVGQDAGLAFYYDQPSAQSPQAIALAVPARSFDEEEPVAPWTFEDLLDSVTSMIDEAKLRAANPTHLQGLGPLTPMTTFPTNMATLFDIDLFAIASGETGSE